MILLYYRGRAMSRRVNRNFGSFSVGTKRRKKIKLTLDIRREICIINISGLSETLRLGCSRRVKIGEFLFAGMAELADAQDSGSCRGNPVQVQVLLPAP